MKNKKNILFKIFEDMAYLALSMVIILVFALFIYIIPKYFADKESESYKTYPLEQAVTDEYGYGETAIGTSGMYVLVEDRELLDGAGYEMATEDNTTGWTVTIIVDSNQQTEYLIFKDTTTGNICSVERRKYEEQNPYTFTVKEEDEGE